MRTVDPSLWSKKLKRRKLQLARPLRFGQRVGFEACVRSSFRDAMGEFWRHCSVEGVSRIVSEDTPRCESSPIQQLFKDWNNLNDMIQFSTGLDKPAGLLDWSNVNKVWSEDNRLHFNDSKYRWLLLLFISLVVGSVTLSMNLTQLITEPPLVISLQNAQHSIEDLPFPAVALCSLNVISKRRLDHITALLVDHDQNRTYTPRAIRRYLLDSGALLTLALPQVDIQFAHYLSNINPDKKLNITLLMLELAPSCESMLLKCSWAGKEKPCTSLFATRITSVGVCCVFNARYEDFDRHTPPQILKKVGSNNGLAVAIRENTDDFAYVRKPSIGIEVLIFDGTEYPLLEGGSVRVQLAQREASLFYTVSIRAQVISPEIVYFNEAWRGCRISQSSQSRQSRSYGWCLLECRRYAALQLCGCVPYMLQPREEQVCTLNELSCLNKHREKFMYYNPAGYSLEDPVGEALSEELQDALVCSDCRADCARPVYRVTPTYAVFPKYQESLFLNRFAYGINRTNMSVLRFFYSSEDQHLFAVMSNTGWYETVGLISSQWVILLGISLVSVMELLFHCTVRWRHHYVRRKRLRV